MIGFNAFWTVGAFLLFVSAGSASGWFVGFRLGFRPPLCPSIGDVDKVHDGLDRAFRNAQAARLGRPSLHSGLLQARFDLSMSSGMLTSQKGHSLASTSTQHSVPLRHDGLAAERVHLVADPQIVGRYNDAVDAPGLRGSFPSPPNQRPPRARCASARPRRQSAPVRSAKRRSHASCLDQGASNAKPDLDMPGRNCRTIGTQLEPAGEIHRPADLPHRQPGRLAAPQARMALELQGRHPIRMRGHDAECQNRLDGSLAHEMREDAPDGAFAGGLQFAPDRDGDLGLPPHRLVAARLPDGLGQLRRPSVPPQAPGPSRPGFEAVPPPSAASALIAAEAALAKRRPRLIACIAGLLFVRLQSRTSWETRALPSTAA